MSCNAMISLQYNQFRHRNEMIQVSGDFHDIIRKPPIQITVFVQNHCTVDTSCN